MLIRMCILFFLLVAYLLFRPVEVPTQTSDSVQEQRNTVPKASPSGPQWILHKSRGVDRIGIQAAMDRRHNPRDLPEDRMVDYLDWMAVIYDWNIDFTDCHGFRVEYPLALVYLAPASGKGDRLLGVWNGLIRRVVLKEMDNGEISVVSSTVIMRDRLEYEFLFHQEMVLESDLNRLAESIDWERFDHFARPRSDVLQKTVADWRRSPFALFQIGVIREKYDARISYLFDGLAGALAIEMDSHSFRGMRTEWDCSHRTIYGPNTQAVSR